MHSLLRFPRYLPVIVSALICGAPAVAQEANFTASNFDLLYAATGTWGTNRPLPGYVADALGMQLKLDDPLPDNWGPAQQGVRVSLSLEKSTYAVSETIPLHIKAQIVSAGHPLYATPDRPTGALLMRRSLARAFHLTIIDERGRTVVDGVPSLWSDQQSMAGGSSDPLVCPVPLEVGRVYSLIYPANARQNLLPTEPGTYRVTVTWSPYPASDPPCDNVRARSDSQELRSFGTVSSVPVTIHIIRLP